MRFRGPLADSYPAAVALVVSALVPYLALSAALTPLEPFVLGGARLQLPDHERWEKGDEPAWHSPPLADRIRGDRPEPEPEAERWERGGAGALGGQ